MLPKEQEEVQEQIRDFAAELQKTVSIEKIREIAAEAVELPEMSKGDSGLRDHLEGSTEEKHVHIESVTDSIIESSARDRTEAREMTDKAMTLTLRSSLSHGMKPSVFIMRITCGYWKNREQGSVTFHRSTIPGCRKAAMAYCLAEAIRSFIYRNWNRMDQ